MKSLFVFATLCFFFAGCGSEPSQESQLVSTSPGPDNICLYNACVQGSKVGTTEVYDQDYRFWHAYGTYIEGIPAVNVYDTGCTTVSLDRTKKYDLYVYGTKCLGMSPGQTATLTSSDYWLPGYCECKF